MSFFTGLIIMAIGTLIILSGSLLHSFIESNKRVARLFTSSLYCLQTKSGLKGFVFIVIRVGKEDCKIEVSNTYTHKILKNWTVKEKHKAIKFMHCPDQYLTIKLSKSNDFVSTIINFH